MELTDLLGYFANTPGYLICLIVIWQLFKQVKEKDAFTTSLLSEVNKTNTTLIELATLVKLLVDRGNKEK